MNRWTGMGRLTGDPEIRYTQGNEHQIAKYTLAVDRRVARNNGETTADFIQIQCWDKKAEFASKYLHKGTKVLVTGRIQTGSYTDKDGNKRYTFDVVAEEQEFCESKKTNDDEEPVNNCPAVDAFVSIPEGVDEDLPFAMPSGR